MDVIMFGPGVFSCQNGLDHGRHQGWAMDLPFWNGLDHGRHHAWGWEEGNNLT